MSTLTLNTVRHGAPRAGRIMSLLSRLFASLSTFSAGARDGREIEASYRAYARMTRDELRRRRLARGDVFTAALKGRPV